ncbi:hypothetical protein Pyn_13682 [Prunus yedoensis var. nudiflora]|uniref:Cytochrome P450 704C1 n=1 Tax=Prunus yedoensis var. nudiflora TaxID=2094558 RepID=A0A314YKJ9_PRUYE|nr:hypothetical protein Pyn_13682 [Prunus yedoensis var. nudiflora]
MAKNGYIIERYQACEISSEVVRDLGRAVFKTNGVNLLGLFLKLQPPAKQQRSKYFNLDVFSFWGKDLFTKAASDSIVKVLLGIDLDTMYGTNEEATQFSNAFDVANEMAIYRYADFSWKIKNKIETVPNSGDELHLKKRDIVSRVLESGEADPKYLRDMIYSIIIAGKDTTGSALTWLIYMLCKHPHIQEKIAKEVREATNLKDNSRIDELAASLTEEALDKMQYLVAALTETTRLYPAVPMNAKICFSDDTWPDGFSVKKRDMVGYNACSMGRMKHLWGDDAEEFRPERWLDENGRFQQESSFKFTAFGAGPRICPEKDFAYKATKIFSAVLLGSCIFKLRDENEVAKYKIKITHHIDGGLYVQASPRLLFDDQTNALCCKRCCFPFGSLLHNLIITIVSML